MHIPFILRCFFKLILADDYNGNLFFYPQEKHVNELKKEFLEAFKELSDQKNFVVISNDREDNHKEIFFIDIKDGLAEIIVKPDSKDTPDKFMEKILSVKIQDSLELAIKQLTTFIEHRCDIGKTPMVYFTINGEFFNDTLSEEDIKMVENVKQEIQKNLNKVFAENIHIVEFYHPKLLVYAETLFCAPPLDFSQRRDNFYQCTPPKGFKKEDTIIVPISDDRIIVYFTGKLIYNSNSLIHTYVDKITNRDHDILWREKDRSKHFYNSFLKDLGKLSIEDLTVQIRTLYRTYSCVLKLIFSVLNDLKYDLTPVVKEHLIDNIPEGFSEEIKEKIINCPNYEEITTSILIANLKNCDKDRAYTIALIIKFICSDNTFIEIINSSEKLNATFYSNLLQQMKLDLHHYFEIWITNFAKYSHKDDSYPFIEEYESILRILKVNGSSNPSYVEKPIPHYIFLELCKVVQFAFECKQYIYECEQKRK